MVALELGAGIGSFLCGCMTLGIACSFSPDGSCSDIGRVQPLFWLIIVCDGICITIATVFATVLAPRYILSAEVGILMLLEQILSPIWTYIGVGEVPSTWTLVGGGLLLCTLLGQEIANLVVERREASETREKNVTSLEIETTSSA